VTSVFVALAGGVGAAKLLAGLVRVVDPAEVTAVVNTGDDDWFHGLYVSPDPDIVTYTLAGEVDEERGWGLHSDTFRWLESLRRFGHETWFQIGDRDLATHLHRTRLLGDGWALSAVMANIASSFGVGVRLLPMSDDRVRTVVETDGGDLPFQEFLVHRHAQDPVRGIRFEGAALVSPAPGVLDALAAAEAIFIAPSNPIGSIRPILAVPQLRAAVLAARVPRIAVSPIIDGHSLQPPAGEMMAGLGYPVDITGVARVYAGIIDTLIIDTADAARADAVNDEGVRCLVAGTMMRDGPTRRSLAMAALAAAGFEP